MSSKGVRQRAPHTRDRLSTTPGEGNWARIQNALNRDALLFNLTHPELGHLLALLEHPTIELRDDMGRKVTCPDDEDRLFPHLDADELSRPHDAFGARVRYGFHRKRALT